MKIKKQRHKKCIIKGKFKLEDYKNYLKESHLENKISCLGKNKIDVKNFIENHKEFIKSNKRY